MLHSSVSALFAKVPVCSYPQGLHRLEKYLNIEGSFEKTLKIKYALKSTGKSLKGLEKSLNSSIFCKTTLLIEI